jgi:hypothetical protein
VEQHPDFCVRQAEGLSTAHAKAVNRENAQQYFSLLKATMIENDLINPAIYTIWTNRASGNKQGGKSDCDEGCKGNLQTY